jgi:phenylalanyl-tRNA synthetase beta chain
MKISRAWLQKFFDAPLPEASVLADALTFHAFEIEGVDTIIYDSGKDEVLDVKVTPNRGHDCLSHRGIAKELSAILKTPMANDPLATRPVLPSSAGTVTVSVDEPALCPRYIAAHITDVQVGPSPLWLREALEALGQRSINSVVDATNYVMFRLGEPLHAFDARRLSEKGGTRAICVRRARAGESMRALDGKDYTFADSALLIVDAHADAPIGIAGVKGGQAAEVGPSTTDIIIESANFNGVSVRKTAQALRLRTDASSRFEQVISPELALYGMHAVIELIREIAGGTVVGAVDAYPEPQPKTFATLSATQAKQILGSHFGESEIRDAFTRLGFSYTQEKEHFRVEVPFERLDLRLPEDLAEEVGRIIGYKDLPAKELSPQTRLPETSAAFYSAENMREKLLSEGYSEVYTSVFADSGERMVLNKVDGLRPYLRESLVPGLTEAVRKNIQNRMENVRLFEIGVVWKGGKESLMVGTAEKEVREEPLVILKKAPDTHGPYPVSTAKRYEPFSRYPFILRDIALWVPSGTESETVLALIRESAGELLFRSELFDTFEKGDKVSFAFRLIFQSFERTLTDEEVNDMMKKVTDAVEGKGWQVR